MSDQKRLFKVGDKVDFAGFVGVLEDNATDYIYPLRLMGENHDQIFTPEGLYYRDEPNGPRLKLIEAVKTKVQKTLTVWLNVYPWDQPPVLHCSKAQADRHALGNRIACLELTGAYEVEE